MREDVAALAALLPLSAKRREIARRVLGGQRPAQIAAELRISPKTLEAHMAAIGQRLGPGHGGREGVLRYCLGLVVGAHQSAARTAA